MLYFLRDQVLEDFSVEFPDDKIIQITLRRPQKLNAIKLATSHQIAKIWELFDNDESLRVGIITGSGRAFCVGADLDGECHSAQS
jgi:enoyl-CoA hydratase/carnithine racemase